MGTHLLHDVPGLLIHQCLMGVLKDEPVRFRTFPLFLVLIGLGAVSHVDRMAQIHHVHQHISHHIAGPVIRPLGVQPSVGDLIFRVGVHGRREHLFLFELPRNLRGPQTAGAHGEDPPDDLSGLLIHHERPIFDLVLTVAIWRASTETNTALCLGGKYGAHLAAGVTHMPFVEQILEGHEFIAGLIQSVHIVVDGNVAHIVGGEDLLDVETCVELVASQTGQVLGDHDGDSPVLHLLHHLLKCGTVE